jgi:glycosyltransferase involved in cell wall biosynthesis
MKRVAIIRSDFPVISEPFISEQIRHYQSWRPIILRRRASGAHLQHPCVDVAPLRSKLIGAWPHLPAARHVDAARDAGVIHAHFGPDGVYGHALAKRLSRPLVVTFHGYDATLNKRALFASLRPSKLHLLASRKSVFKGATTVIAVSNFLRGKLIAAGCPESKVVRHYIGVDTTKFSPIVYERAAGPLRLVSVGRLVPSKALDVAIKATARVLARGLDCTFEIIGDGPLRMELEALCHQLGSRTGFASSGRCLIRMSWIASRPQISSCFHPAR